MRFSKSEVEEGIAPTKTSDFDGSPSPASTPLGCRTIKPTRGVHPHCNRQKREFLLGDTLAGSRGRDGALYIDHRFADDRCLWSEHPSGASQMSPTVYDYPNAQMRHPCPISLYFFILQRKEVPLTRVKTPV